MYSGTQEYGLESMSLTASNFSNAGVLLVFFVTERVMHLAHMSGKPKKDPGAGGKAAGSAAAPHQ